MSRSYPPHYRRRWLPPTSSCRPSIDLPCGRPALSRPGRSDDLSTFLVIVYRRLRRSLYTGGYTASIPCRYVRDRQPSRACKHREAGLRPISFFGRLRVDDAYDSSFNFALSPFPSPYPDEASSEEVLSRFPPTSVRCRRSFTPRHQRDGSMSS